MESLVSVEAIILFLVTLGTAAAFSLSSSTDLTKNMKSVHSPSRSAVLITGGYRGIGKSTAYHFLAKGYFVFVTVRSQSQYDEWDKDESAPCPVFLDVTRDDQIEAAVKRVQEVCAAQEKSLVAVINNAGINPEGDAYQKATNEGTSEQADDELCDPSVASRVFETNVVGVMRVTKAFLPLMVQDGRIVHIGSYFGSIAGQIGFRQCAYEASKFALEGMADNHRRALKKEKRQIKVSLVKPGNISTDMNSFGEGGPEEVAQAIEHAVGARKPRARYYPGKVQGYSVRFLCWLFEALPTGVSDKLGG